MKSCTWLNGWRRIWIVLTVLSFPVALVSAARLNDRLQSEYWFNAELTARRVASERAYQRITGESINSPLSAGNGMEAAVTPEALALASSLRLQRYSHILANTDAELKADLDAIEREYRRKIEAAYRLEFKVLWLLVVVSWLMFSGTAYIAGATVAWIRRGFGGAA